MRCDAEWIAISKTRRNRLSVTGQPKVSGELRFTSYSRPVMLMENVYKGKNYYLRPQYIHWSILALINGMYIWIFFQRFVQLLKTKHFLKMKYSYNFSKVKYTSNLLSQNLKNRRLSHDQNNLIRESRCRTQHHTVTLCSATLKSSEIRKFFRQQQQLPKFNLVIWLTYLRVRLENIAYKRRGHRLLLQRPL